jgi:hypothetical protein
MYYLEIVERKASPGFIIPGAHLTPRGRSSFFAIYQALITKEQFPAIVALLETAVERGEVLAYHYTEHIAPHN